MLAPAENIGTSTAWQCRCDCGREAVVKTRRLRSGRTVSCGCVHEAGIGSRLTLVEGTCVEMIRAGTVRRIWGSYGSFEEAVKARKRAEEELFCPFLEEFSAGGAPKTPGG